MPAEKIAKLDADGTFAHLKKAYYTKASLNLLTAADVHGKRFYDLMAGGTLLVDCTDAVTITLPTAEFSAGYEFEILCLVATSDLTITCAASAIQPTDGKANTAAAGSLVFSATNTVLAEYHLNEGTKIHFRSMRPTQEYRSSDNANRFPASFANQDEWLMTITSSGAGRVCFAQWEAPATNATVRLGTSGTGVSSFIVEQLGGTNVFSVDDTGVTAIAQATTIAAGGLTVTAGLATFSQGILTKSSTAAAIAAARTLTSADSGATFSVAKTGVYTITLPTPAAGLFFKFLVLDTGANIVTIATTGGAYNFGMVNVNNILLTSAGTNVLLASAGSVGDWVEYRGIDATHYLVTGACAAAADITFS